MNSLHPLWHTWWNMIRRCYDEDTRQYERYGGRGIRVCDRWLLEGGFVHFLEDMGERPEGHTLDRVDIDGPYSPENCRWADRETQANNQSTTQLITHEITGETLSQSQWSRRLGGQRDLVITRLRRGWLPQAAITTPPRNVGGRTHSRPTANQSADL